MKMDNKVEAIMYTLKDPRRSSKTMAPSSTLASLTDPQPLEQASINRGDKQYSRSYRDQLPHYRTDSFSPLEGSESDGETSISRCECALAAKERRQRLGQLKSQYKDSMAPEEDEDDDDQSMDKSIRSITSWISKEGRRKKHSSSRTSSRSGSETTLLTGRGSLGSSNHSKKHGSMLGRMLSWGASVHSGVEDEEDLSDSSFSPDDVDDIFNLSSDGKSGKHDSLDSSHHSQKEGSMLGRMLSWSGSVRSGVDDTEDLSDSSISLDDDDFFKLPSGGKNAKLQSSGKSFLSTPDPGTPSSKSHLGEHEIPKRESSSKRGNGKSSSVAGKGDRRTPSRANSGKAQRKKAVEEALKTHRHKKREDIPPAKTSRHESSARKHAQEELDDPTGTRLRRSHASADEGPARTARRPPRICQSGDFAAVRRGRRGNRITERHTIGDHTKAAAGGGESIIFDWSAYKHHIELGNGPAQERRLHRLGNDSCDRGDDHKKLRPSRIEKTRKTTKGRLPPLERNLTY